MDTKFVPLVSVLMSLVGTLAAPAATIEYVGTLPNVTTAPGSSSNYVFYGAGAPSNLTNFAVTPVGLVNSLPTNSMLIPPGNGPAFRTGLALSVPGPILDANVATIQSSFSGDFHVYVLYGNQSFINVGDEKITLFGGAVTASTPTFADTKGQNFFADFLIHDALATDIFTISATRTSTFAYIGGVTFDIVKLTLAGTVIQNVGGPNTPTSADFTVDGAGTTQTSSQSNTINSLLLTPGSSLQIYNTLIVTSGNVGDTGAGHTSIQGGTLYGPNGLAFHISGLMDVTSTLQGDLTKTGPGSLLLNGTLQGSAQVLAGLFGGNAHITGNLLNSSLVSPGNSPGTIYVGGNYTQTSSGTLRIEIGGRRSGQYDRLIVGGQAGLDGHLELIRLHRFDLKRGDKITFLTAEQGVEGTFASVDNPFHSTTILEPTLVYGDREVSLEMVRGSFEKYADHWGLTPNQQAVAAALDGVSADDVDHRALVYLDQRDLSKLPGDFDKIAPEELTSIFTLSTSLSQVQGTNLQRRTDDIRTGANGFSAAGLAINGQTPSYSGGMDFRTGAAGPTGEGQESKEVKTVVAAEKKFGAFLTGVGEWVDVGGDGNARGFDLTTGGFTIGLDYKVSPGFAIGVTAGYAGTVADLTDDGRVWVNGGKLGIYATVFTGGFYVDAAVTGGYNSYDIKRSALQGTARGSTEGGELNVLLGTGYDWKVGALSIGPTATFHYTLVGMDGFTEHGSLAPLEIGSQTTESLRSALGFKASYDWRGGGVVIKPELRAAWQHEYGDTSYDLSASFAGGAGNDFLVRGPETGRDSLLLGAGFAVQMSETCTAYLYYDGELAREDYTRHSISGGVRVAF